MKAAVLSGDDLRRRKSLALSPPQHSHVAIKRGENVETHDDRIVAVSYTHLTLPTKRIV